MAGWRTVVLSEFDKLSLENGCVLVEGEYPLALPIVHLREIIIENTRGSLTIPLLRELTENGVNVVFCDRRHIPDCFLSGLNLHTDAAGCLMDQIAWDGDRKDELWARIVKNKIDMQRELLLSLGLWDYALLKEYAAGILPGDVTNREGQAARIYFGLLFGEDFIRHAEDDTNASLNYGYAILLSMAARIITAHGYNMALGIHHCSRENALNLACDLMEPFRPLVDTVVAANPLWPLDKERKKQLVSVMQCECRYGKKHMGLNAAMESFFLDMVRSLEEENIQLKEVGFAG